MVDASAMIASVAAASSVNTLVVDGSVVRVVLVGASVELGASSVPT